MFVGDQGATTTTTGGTGTKRYMIGDQGATTTVNITTTK